VGEDYGVLLSCLTPQNYFNNTNSIYYDDIKATYAYTVLLFKAFNKIKGVILVMPVFP
jgi:hypothetical protein